MYIMFPPPEGSSILDLDENVSRVYGYGSLAGPHQDTFWLEVYFHDDKPKLCLEFFTRAVGGKGQPLTHFPIDANQALTASPRPIAPMESD